MRRFFKSHHFFQELFFAIQDSPLIVVLFCSIVAKLRQTYFIAAVADFEMESLSVSSNCSLHTGKVELKSEELATVDASRFERFDSVESFQTGTSTETYETVRLD